MSNQITVPVIDYRMDKVKFFIVAALVVVILLFLLNPGGFISKIISGIIDGIGNIIKGVGSGIGKGLYDVSGQAQADATNDSFSSRIDNYWKGTTWVNWMTADLYNSSPSDVSIDEATATNLFNNVNAATGTQVLGVLLNTGDMTGIQSDFQNVVGNKTDISYVSYIAQQKTGNSLGDIFSLTKNFYNAIVGVSGKENIEMMADFLDWANTLPVN